MSENGKPVSDSLWFYAPNKGAPVFFAVAFGASAVCHIWQTSRYKSWLMTGVLVFSTIIFTAGFIAREIAAFDYGNLVKLIVSQCLVYVAPPLYELANYQILGRILYFVPHLSPIHPGRVITTFAFISMIVEVLNGNGVANAVNTALPQSKQDLGKALLKTALLLQIAIVTVFLALAATFHRRCVKAGIRNAKLTNVLLTLYVSATLIMVRTIYRTVEYFGEGQVNYNNLDDPESLAPELRYEWFFYFFEATLMLCNAYLWNFRHPRRYLPQSTKVYLAQDGVTELVGPGYKDTRPFLLTLVDPFDLGSLCGGRRRQNRFWEEDQRQGDNQACSGEKAESSAARGSV